MNCFLCQNVPVVMRLTRIPEKGAATELGLCRRCVEREGAMAPDFSVAALVARQAGGAGAPPELVHGPGEPPILPPILASAKPAPDAPGSGFEPTPPPAAPPAGASPKPPVVGYTDRARQALGFAREEAARRGHAVVRSAHLLLGLLRLEAGVAWTEFDRVGVSGAKLGAEAERLCPGTGGEKPATGAVPFHASLERVAGAAAAEARALKHGYVGTEHLLLGLLQDEAGGCGALLRRFGLTLEEARHAAVHPPEPTAPAPEPPTASPPAASAAPSAEPEPAAESTGASASPPAAAAGSARRTPALEAFCRDLGEQVRQGRLWDTVGRVEIIERVLAMLCCRTPNHPVLVGEPGVGKSAILAGVAREIVRGSVPRPLSGKRLLQLEVGLVVAGTRYRGQLEERVEAMLQEMRRVGDVILVIEELPTVVGAGTLGGAQDLAELLRPALAAVEIRCLGTATPVEFGARLASRANFFRCFQPVAVAPTSLPETREILSGVRGALEVQHRVAIADEAIEAAARLAAGHQSDRHLPGSAVALLDQAAAYAAIRADRVPPEIDRLGAEAEELRRRKEQAIRDQDFGAAADLRDAEKKAREALSAARGAWGQRERWVTVAEADVLAVLPAAGDGPDAPAPGTSAV